MDNNPIPVTPIDGQRVNPLALDVNRLSSSNMVRDLARRHSFMSSSMRLRAPAASDRAIRRPPWAVGLGEAFLGAVAAGVGRQHSHR
jgi:hypothetical protein